MRSNKASAKRGKQQVKELIISLPMFGLVLTLFTYLIGNKIKSKFNKTLVNPLLISIVLTIGVLVLFDIPFEAYNVGASVITMFLAPATAFIGLSIYRQFNMLKKYFVPILAGCLVGSLVSVISSVFLCRLFGLEESLTASMIPRAVTSPIAMEISEAIGGIVPVTVSAVIFSGIMGAAFAPLLIKLFKMKNKVGVGVAIGTSSSAIGTAKAIELGEIQGAMSGLSIGITGLITVIISLFI